MFLCSHLENSCDNLVFAASIQDTNSDFSDCHQFVDCLSLSFSFIMMTFKMISCMNFEII